MRRHATVGPRARLATALATFTLIMSGANTLPAVAAAPTPPPIAAKPAGVPAHYVSTPAGYMDPACVLDVKETDVVLDDPATGGILIADISNNPAARAAVDRTTQLHRSGTPASMPKDLPAVAALVTPAERSQAVKKQPCTSPRFDRAGHQVSSQQLPEPVTGPAQTPTPDGWAVNNQWNGTTMQHLHSEWTVPAGPATDVGQTIFIFPGFQDRVDSAAVIYQPVLGWFGGGWYIDSWACCRSGYANHIGWTPVTGSTVSGDVTGSNCSNGICNSWMVQILDKGSQRSVTYNTSGTGRSMRLTVGSALEVYGVPSCSALPTSGETQSFNTSFYDTLGARRYFSYDTVATSANDCGYSGDYGATTQALYWRT